MFKKKRKENIYKPNAGERNHWTFSITFSFEISSGSGFIMASGCGANIAQVTVALWALMPSQKSLLSRRT